MSTLKAKGQNKTKTPQMTRYQDQHRRDILFILGGQGSIFYDVMFKLKFEGQVGLKIIFGNGNSMYWP